MNINEQVEDLIFEILRSLVKEISDTIGVTEI